MVIIHFEKSSHKIEAFFNHTLVFSNNAFDDSKNF
jgi:hypothetical protein